jgi:hypothetical protein
MYKERIQNKIRSVKEKRRLDGIAPGEEGNIIGAISRMIVCYSAFFFGKGDNAKTVRKEVITASHTISASFTNKQVQTMVSIYRVIKKYHFEVT